MKPISKRLLIHSAIAYKKTGLSSDRQPEWDDGTELYAVRFVFTKASTNTDSGASPADQLVMYFDCKNSEPEGFVPEIGMKIVWNAAEFLITSVMHAYAQDVSVHHWEVSLV